MSGLYIHIPFCTQFCAYCDFYSVRSLKPNPRFLQSLKEEMAIRHNYIESPNTLYIGGGTPSLYKPEQLIGLIEEAKKLWKVDFKEITVEMNPEDVTFDYCCTLAAGGVNRLSLGIQSFFDEHLLFMNRRHNVKQGIMAVESARRAGFQNISIDLIFGFPGLSQKQWEENIRHVLALAPEHLSAYQLGIDPGSLFYRKMQMGLLDPVSQELAADQYALLQKLLLETDLVQYEVSNFARKGYRSIHNSAYWQGISYLGLGPSAHSYNGVARHANMRHLNKYMEGVESLQLAIKEERLTPKKKYHEFVMTRLRTIEGFSREALKQQKWPKEIQRHFEQVADILLQQGLLKEEQGIIKILPEKWFISDRIIRELMM